MKNFAIVFIVVVVLALVVLTLFDLWALQEITATEIFKEILNKDESSVDMEQVFKLAADQVVFGERAYQRWLFQVSTLGLVVFSVIGVFCWIGYQRLISPLRIHYQSLLRNQELKPVQTEFRELRLLVEAFAEAQKQLGERERGEVARYVVHQMKNLWTPVVMVGSLLKTNPQHADATELARLLEDQTAKLNRLLDLFKGLYQFPEPRVQELRPAQLVSDVEKNTGIPLRLLADDSATESIMADETLFSQALENIVRNAWEAQDQQGVPIEIILRKQGLCIRDHGCGFKNSQKAQGLGLGLKFAEKVALAHGMKLTHHDLAEGGAMVCFEKDQS